MWFERAFPKRLVARLALSIVLALVTAPVPLAAETVIPRFTDPKVRVERPDTSGMRVVRFLTDDEFPPLHFADPDGGLAGFSIDLARAVCERIGMACTIQARRFDTLLDSLAEGRGDVVAAAIPASAALRERFATSAIYHRTPARFVARAERARAEVSPESLGGARVAVVEGSAHAAFLGAFFPRAERRTAGDVTLALALLRQGEVDYVFADAGSLALWLGASGGSGYAFAGGPYLDNRYFGEGVGFVVRRDNQLLRQALDYGLQQVFDDGTYAKLYLRYFPVGLY